MTTATLVRVVACLAFVAAAAHAASSPTPGRVLVVYNQAWTHDSDGDGVADSEEVARAYAAARGIPAANLLALSCTTTGDYYYYYSGQWDAFRTEMLAPIKAKLAALGPTSIDVICFCYGVPYTVYPPSTNSTVSIDNVVMALNWWSDDGMNVGWNSNPYFEPTPGFATDIGHFDHAAFTVGGTTMYLVSRLDGPRGVTGALELIDQARYADRFLGTAAGAYHGTVYIDSRDGQGGGGTRYTDAFLAASADVQSGNYFDYYPADQNMAWAEHAAAASGLPWKWENTAWDTEIGQTGAQFSDGTSGETAPDALFYGGWYNYGTYHDVFRWLPGSVACDLNSDSLFQGTLRNPAAAQFGTSALARGCTAVAGVIDEPYLTGHPRPNVLLWYLLHGYTFAEASALATPAIGWMPISIGDPLYAPLAAKPLVLDARAPQLAATPTIVAGATADAPIVAFVVGAASEPEVAQVDVDFGATTAYGATASSAQGWWRRHRIALSGVAAGAPWHFRLRLRDPAGNTTTTGDFAVDAGGVVVAGGTTTGGTGTGGTSTGGTSTGGTSTGGTSTGGSTGGATTAGATSGSGSGGGGRGCGRGAGGGLIAVGVALTLVAQRRPRR